MLGKGIVRMMKKTAFVALLTLTVSSFLFPITSASAANPVARMNFSTSSIEVGQTTSANLCETGGVKGEILSYQEAFGTHSRWVAIFHSKLTKRSQCFTYTYSEKVQGLYQFRLEILSKGRKVSLTGLKRLYVFAPISVLELNKTVGMGCTDNGTPLSSGGHLYQTFCSYQYSTTRSGSINSCRSMTLSFIATDDSTGTNTQPGSVTLQILQSTLNAQNFNFPDDALTAENIQLDGSQFQLNFSDTNSNAVLYVVSTGSADCYTVTGAA